MSSIFKIGSINDVSSSSVNTLSSTCGFCSLFLFSLLPCSDGLDWICFEENQHVERYRFVNIRGKCSEFIAVRNDEKQIILNESTDFEFQRIYFFFFVTDDELFCLFRV